MANPFLRNNEKKDRFQSNWSYLLILCQKLLSLWHEKDIEGSILYFYCLHINIEAKNINKNIQINNNYNGTATNKFISKIQERIVVKLMGLDESLYSKMHSVEF